MGDNQDGGLVSRMVVRRVTTKWLTNRPNSIINIWRNCPLNVHVNPARSGHHQAIDQHKVKMQIW